MTQTSTRAAPERLRAALGLVLLLCLPVLLVVTIHRGANRHLLGPGDPAPTLTLRELNSNNIRHVEFKGKLSAVLFFSVGCPHCQREISNFDRLNKTFGNDMFFLAISESDNSKTVELKRSSGFKVTTVLDEGGDASQAFGVEIVPATFLIKIDGTVAYSGSGEETRAARERLLRDFASTNKPMNR